MKRFRVLSFIVGMASAMLFAPSVVARTIPEFPHRHAGNVEAYRSWAGDPESVRGGYGNTTLQELPCLSLLDHLNNGHVVNLATDTPFVGTSVFALADIIRNSSQTGILVMLGSLLLLLGTVLRRNLRAPDEPTSPHPSPPWVESMPMRTHFGVVDGVASTAASRTHANAV